MGLSNKLNEKDMTSTRTLNWMVLTFALVTLNYTMISAQIGTCKLPLHYNELPPKQPLMENSLVDVDFESSPGSEYVIYLDFDGETVTSWWGSSINNPIVAAPASYFSASEKESICKQVAADFQPFDVNVTLKLSVFEAAEGKKKVQAVFSPTNYFRPNVDGVAERYTFNYGNSPVAWIFTNQIAWAAQVASHEIGHTLGLSHDGVSGGSAYYGGHNGWTPIMGGGSYVMGQWSKGEYQNANNHQDDLAQISKMIPYRKDDWGSSLSSPSNLKNLVDPSNNFSGEGLISKTDDKDIFIFSTNAIVFNLSVGCADEGAYNNLRLKATIRNQNGDEIYSRTTVSKQDMLTGFLPAGTYYLEFDGVGYLDPLTDGYSDYGSLGKYHFSGSFGPLFDNEDLGISSIDKLDNVTCTETITAKINVHNYGSVLANNYVINIKDDKNTLTTKNLNPSIAAGDSTIILITFTPSSFDNFSFIAEIEYANDAQALNNEKQSSVTKYLFGEDIRFELGKDALGSTHSWTITSSTNGRTVINSSNVTELNAPTIVSSTFCLPKDSCFDIIVENPFQVNWCAEIGLNKYSVWNFPANHIFQKGDTVQIFTALGPKLFVLETAMDQPTVANTWQPEIDPNFTPIECLIPSGLKPYFSFTRIADESEYYSEVYIKEKTKYSTSFCTNSIATSTKKFNNSTIKMFPNPAKSIVHFESFNNIQSLTLYNSLGEKVKEVYNQDNLDVSYLPSGIYYVKIYTNTVEIKSLIVK